MAKVTFHHQDGTDTVVDADPGSNVMRAAVQNSVSGIVGECGGQAMCATCHVYVPEPFLSQLDPISEDEDEMLDCTASPREANSRLGCQIVVGDTLEEVEVHVPDAQI